MKVSAEQKKRCAIKSFRCQVPGLYPNRVVVDIDLEFYSRVLKKWILLFNPGDLQTLILISGLIIVTIFPQDADENGILPEFIGTPHVGSGQESQTPTVNLQGLMDGKFHREICHFL